MKYPFQKLKQFSFWDYQITAWIIFYLVDLMMMLNVRHVPTNEVIQETIEFFAGFLLTSLLRRLYISIRFLETRIPVLVAVIVFCSFCFAFFWYATTLLFVGLLIPDQFKYINSLGTGFRYTLSLSMLILGWSASYFGTKFWLVWTEERERAAQAQLLAQRARLQMLRYQVNPHFLFNALNSIRALTSEDAQNAKTMITELSEFLRYSLMHRNRPEVTVKEEIDAIRHYLSIEKKRFEDKLEIELDIDPATEPCRILSFLIHPLVENAVKHGMQSNQLPLRIRISTAADGEKIRVSVSNTGGWHEKGPAGENNGTGTGMENVRARLENAFSGRYRFDISRDNGNVVVTIEIPRDETPIPESE
jgi:two-component system, LytTR family, sensor kinase